MVLRSQLLECRVFGLRRSRLSAFASKALSDKGATFVPGSCTPYAFGYDSQRPLRCPCDRGISVVWLLEHLSLVSHKLNKEGKSLRVLADVSTRGLVFVWQSVHHWWGLNKVFTSSERPVVWDEGAIWEGRYDGEREP